MAAVFVVRGGDDGRCYLYVVVLIQVVYDVLRGPAPNRFGFWTNFLYDSILITVHVIVATGIIRLVRVLGTRAP